MKTAKIILATAALMIISAEPAMAGSFAEGFRKFVLGPEAEAYSVSLQQNRLDQAATECMGCHNGTAATHITIKNADAPLQVRGIQTVNHPVGMSYDTYALRHPRGYRPRSTLPSSIHLVDGKVTCISCHKIKEDRMRMFADSRDKGAKGNGGCSASKLLTVGPRETDLCMSCHVK